MNIIKTMVLLFSSISLIECSQIPNEEEPGSCTLSCAGSSVAAYDAQLEFFDLDPEAPVLNVSCPREGDATSQETSPLVPIRFRVFREIPAFPSEQKTPDSTENGSDPAVANYKQHISGISFEPLIQGGATLGAADSIKSLVAGILTPFTEWCTDSCGVGSVSIQPDCGSLPNDVKLLVRSGSLSKVITVRMQ